jgi:hypothetical protein
MHAGPAEFAKGFRSEASAKTRHCSGTMAKINAPRNQLFDYLWMLLYTIASLFFSLVAFHHLSHYFVPITTEVPKTV